MIRLPSVPGGFACILADPPWRFNSLWGGRPKMVNGSYPSRAVDAHYDTMTFEEINALPVGEVAAKNSVLFLWLAWPILPKAMQTIEAWGFTYKTCGFNWTKTNKNGTPFVGLGYWTRANSEVCLIATRGKPKRIAKNVSQIVWSGRREHSRKPDEVHARIEALVPGPRLELFARETRPGWTSWGNEATKFNSGLDARPISCDSILTLKGDDLASLA